MNDTHLHKHFSHRPGQTFKEAGCSEFVQFLHLCGFRCALAILGEECLSFGCSNFGIDSCNFSFIGENPHHNFCHRMCTLEDDELEREIVQVGLELHAVNVKLQTQLSNLKQLCRVYEASSLVEHLLEAPGYPFSLGSHALPPSFVCSNSQTATTSLSICRIDLRVVVLPLLEYDRFYWRKHQLFVPTSKRPGYAYTSSNPLHDCIGFQHVPVAVLKGKDVDMPYGLWENLHRFLVDTGNVVAFRLDCPELHRFYMTMEEQLCRVTVSNAVVAHKEPHVPKFPK